MNYQSTAEFKRVSPEQIARASRHQAAILCDFAGRRGTMHARIKALHPGMQVCGSTYTVEMRRGGQPHVS